MREIVKQGKHVKLVVDTNHGMLHAYIDDFQAQILGEVWGITNEDMINKKTYTKDGIDYIELEFDGIITYYSDGMLNIDRGGDFDKLHNLKHTDDVAKTSGNLCQFEIETLIQAQHLLSLSAKDEMWVIFKDGIKITCKIEKNQ